MTKRQFWGAVGIAGSLFVCAGLAHADIQTINIAIPTTPISDKGYNGLLAIAQFTPAHDDEYLTQIDFELVTDFTGKMGFENLDENFSTFFQLELTWFLEIDRPDDQDRGDVLLALSATRLVQGLAGPFDGQVDFGGSSGFTYQVGAQGISAAATTTDESDLLLFTGDGFVELPVAAWFEGVAQAQTDHEYNFWNVSFSGQLVVTYTYVPEPAGLGLLLVGPLLLWRFRR